MTTKARLAELQTQHRRLEKNIHDRMQDPKFDQVKVTELKRKKLRIKDEINRLAE